MKAKLLLIEDEKGLIITITDRLENEGYKVDHSLDGEEGYNKAISGDYDLIILDIMLPKKDGLEICRDLRAEKNNLPIIMLTAKGELLDKVIGFKMGADDYLTKPFEMLELISRIEALLRRSSSKKIISKTIYQFGDFTVDFRNAQVLFENNPINLTAKEYKLLKYFIERRNELITRDELLDAVWDYNSTVTTRTVDVHIAWLRQKLEEDINNPKYIITVHGMGYKFIG